MPKQPPVSKYELARLENLRRNKQVMQEIFGGMQQEMQQDVRAQAQAKRAARESKKRMRMRAQQQQQQQQHQTSSADEEGTLASPRRSSRVRKETVLYTGLDDLPTPSQPRRKRQRKAKQAKRQREPLTEEQRNRIKTAENWMEDMENFLYTVPHGRNGKTCGDQNVRTVMRQVRVLASGAGVTYKWWPEGVVFAKNEPVNMQTDFLSLYERAHAFEAEHGRDRGNGWLLLHPITKLACYQVYKLEQLSAAAGGINLLPSSPVKDATSRSDAKPQPATGKAAAGRKKDASPSPQTSTEVATSSDAPPKKGRRVRVYWPMQNAQRCIFAVKPYMGTVTRIRKNGTFDVRFDGDGVSRVGRRGDVELPVMINDELTEDTKQSMHWEHL